MFVFYSSDNCIEYRPWLAYLTFPAIVAAAFVLAVEGPIPEPRSMLVFNLVAISELVVLTYMITVFFVLWTFGRAVCAKVGNVVYIVTLALSAMLGFGVIIAFGEDTIWLLSWVVHCLAVHFMLLPANLIGALMIWPHWHRTLVVSSGPSASSLWTISFSFFFRDSSCCCSCCF